ncbi:hypothetical protein J1605_013088 [Eschrichtius robustus]|uniref:Uncharacterized protein n=1 Tax=Eschrichtius robustus TaxID=9764 RepID=A0AB34GHC4_ESCRO|nr:hypothetical protein J1605_013088 [Eschrichtius robustus]
MGQELCAKTLQPGCSCRCCWEGGDAHSHQRSAPVMMEAAIKLTDLKEASCSMTSFHPRGLQAVRARKFKSKRPRSNSDSFQEEDLSQGFQWRESLPFGAASSYLNLEKLGEGSYATVYKGISRQKWAGLGLPWWRSSWESTCQCRRHGFDPWSGKIPHAVEQVSLCATAAEPALWSTRTTATEPVCHNY